MDKKDSLKSESEKHEMISTIEEEKIGLVVHDWGGMIGIAGAMKAGKKIDGLVVMNTAITAPKDGFKPTWFHSLSQVPLISSFLFRGLNFPLSFLNRFASVPGSFDSQTMKAYKYPLRKFKDKCGPLALARMVPNSMHQPSVPLEKEIEEKEKLINNYFSKTQKKAVRDLVLNEGIRLDGRKSSEIRPIWTETNYLPSTHGSAIFTRGETQALASVTLGTSREANMIDVPTNQGEETFYLHYNFPPFSTGEVRRLMGTSRREIGHGNLAQRALQKVMPIDCPYTVRIVSEILESNGSSSMASVCAGSIALMDAGVKIKKNVSGIAMGLITDNDKHAVLSDILGDEDYLGDMDFKVTGTEDGITACQMDIKIKGLKHDILIEALNQAKEGRLEILKKLNDEISNPNDSVKAHAPKMVKVEIKKDFIGLVIGPGGKNIQELQKETDTTVVINEEDEKGIVEILGVDQDKIDNAIERINNLVFEPVNGDTYNVKVLKILDFGAVIEFVPGKEALLHVSEIAWERVEKVTDYLNIGDKIEVKYLGTDPRTRKPKISRKVLLKKSD